MSIQGRGRPIFECYDDRNQEPGLLSAVSLNISLSSADRGASTISLVINSLKDERLLILAGELHSDNGAVSSTRWLASLDKTLIAFGVNSSLSVWSEVLIG
jgi:hypothetical protein